MSNLLLDLRYQKLTTLADLTIPSNITELLLDYNNLTSLQGLPSGITKLSVNNNYNLTSLQYAPDSITELYADNCSITSSTPVPLNIEYLSLNFNNLTNFSFVKNSTNLYTLSVNNNLISSFIDCPPITFLYISNNNLTNLQNLPTSIVFFDISNNPLTTLEDFTTDHTVQTLNISNTRVTSLTGIPPTCQFIYNYNNNNMGIYLNPPQQVIKIQQDKFMSESLNKPIMFPFSHNGASIRTTTLSRLSSIIYPGHNLQVSYATFNLEIISSGTVTIKLVQISKRSKLGVTLFTTTCDQDNFIYELAIPTIQNIPSKIELQANISNKNVDATMYSFMLY
jgi:hypothetical protein